MGKKALLMILDGWGLGDHGKDDAIFSTPTPYWDYLLKTYPHSCLQASGENVGLPDGQMGNSEVGHLNIGAGRIVYQDLVKINRACADGSIAKNPEVAAAFAYARDKGNVHPLLHGRPRHRPQERQGFHSAAGGALQGFGRACGVDYRPLLRHGPRQALGAHQAGL